MQISVACCFWVGCKEVYPHLVCNKCYLAMKRIEKSKESGIVLNSRLSLSSWLPHSDESCLVCRGETQSNDQCRKSTSGRPRNDDITHLSRKIMKAVNNINPPSTATFP